LGDFESPFEAAVAERLSAKGWVLHPQIGVSGFRVDLGVVDKDTPGAFLAGIECDGATYHRGATARDRDRLRQVVLEGLGWRIIRIWSTDWWTNAQREIERVHATLEAVQADVRAKRDQEPPTEQSLEVTNGSEGGTSNLAQDSRTTVFEDAPDCDEVLPALDPARFYEDDYRPVLAKLAISELANSGPLRLDRLVQRIARAHGFQRAGREIQERVATAVPRGCGRTTDPAGTFIWPLDVSPADWQAFRKPASGASRDPSEVSMEELALLAKECLVPHRNDDDVLIAMRDACGLLKLREASRERFRAAIGKVRGCSGTFG
jgi:very-short-patch-repair endonuclease